MPPRPTLPADLVEILERWGQVQADAARADEALAQAIEGHSATVQRMDDVLREHLPVLVTTRQAHVSQLIADAREAGRREGRREAEREARDRADIPRAARQTIAGALGDKAIRQALVVTVVAALAALAYALGWHP